MKRVGRMIPGQTDSHPLLNSLKPIVSVVIPTRNRPKLLVRAVRSALHQTLTDIEVIVVIDGPDPATEAAMGALLDTRVRLERLTQSVGGSEARNIGVRTSRAPWIAFLDDDDEWLPEKLAVQLSAGESLASDLVFVASYYVERSSNGDRSLPKSRGIETRHPSEALFCRRTLTSGTDYVQTSTWFVSRRLMLEVPFTKGLKRNQDADWLLHALALPAVRRAVVPQALSIFYEDDRPERVSRSADWKFHYDWALSNQQYFTPKAFAFLLLTLCVQDAVSKRQPIHTMIFLLRESLRLGRPTLLSLIFFFYYWLSSETLRQACRTSLRREVACA
ncbi:MAG: glycosyl transferase, group 2 family protein [Acidobacteriaceae bacterium]|jgi:glycosyltransferase involved in cell wall biosynthesis|nr:glycosyl transferase, group 2 family protein [Acidobacteriaceae bacterium]